MEEALSENILNSWSAKQEELLRKWHRYAINSHWKHEASAKKYFFRNKLIGIPATVANAITGTAIFAGISNSSECGTANTITQIVIGSVIIMVTVLMAINNFLNLAQLAEKHSNSANRYKNYADSIEAELVLPRNDRLNGKIFVKQAQKRLMELRETCPNIPNNVELEFKKIRLTEELESMMNIIINDDIQLPIFYNINKQYSKQNNKQSNIENNAEINEENGEENDEENDVNIDVNNNVDDNDTENNDNSYDNSIDEYKFELNDKNINENNINNINNIKSLQDELQEELDRMKTQEQIRKQNNERLTSKKIVDRFIQHF